MKVTVCQIDNRAAQLDGVLAALAIHTNEAATDLLLLPEMCFAEWLAADPVPDRGRWIAAAERHTEQISRLAAFGVEAIIGTRPIVRDHGSSRNQAYLWTKESGAVGIHEKYYLPDEEGYWENTWYDRGEKVFDACRVGEARIGIQICTEMWFFEWARHYAADSADILCVPRVTPHSSIRKWLTGGRTAAICSGAYCLSSNLWMPPGERADCGGVAWIIGPEGDILAETSVDKPFATAEIDLELARASKRTYPRYVPE